MKKFLTKVLPVALVVLAICMTSVSAFAAEATYADGIVTVTTDSATTETTILATRQNGSGTSLNVSDAAAWENIVYIDQAQTSSFKFAPRAGVTGNTVTVFLGGEGASTIEAIDVQVEAPAVIRTLTLNANDGTIVGEVPAEYPETEYTLPAVNKAGYTFDGWFDNEACTGTAVTVIAAGTEGAKSFWAKWTLNATTDSDAGYCAETADSEAKTGVISVTATFGSHVKNITKYGFFVYRTDSFAPVVSDSDMPAGKVDISVTGAASDFFTIVYGIPSANFDTDVIILPYVVADGAVVYGTTEAYTVNNAVDGELKYLGTEANLESQLN